MGNYGPGCYGTWLLRFYRRLPRRYELIKSMSVVLQEENTLRFFVDLLERDGTPAKDVNDFSFSVDDEAIPGQVKTSGFFDTSEQAAVTIVLAAHGDYLAPLIGETSRSTLPSREWLVSSGWGPSIVSLWCYTDRTFRRVSAFTQGDKIPRMNSFAMRTGSANRRVETTKGRTRSLFRELLRAVQGDFRDDFDNEETARQEPS